MTQDENLELSHQHPAAATTTNNLIDANNNNNNNSSGDQQTQLQLNEQQQLQHKSEIHDDINKSEIKNHNTLNCIDINNNCNNICRNCNCNSKCICDDNPREEIINSHLISDILIGISDNNVNCIEEESSANDDIQQIEKIENEITIINLPKLNELQSDLNHNIKSIEVVQLNDTDIKLESPITSNSDNNNNNNNNDDDENNIKFINENKPNNIEDIKFTTLIKNENNFENINVDQNINNLSENYEIKNLDSVTSSVIGEHQINTVTNLVDTEISNVIENTDGNVSEKFENNEQIELKENRSAKINEVLFENNVNNEKLKQNNSENKIEENLNTNIVIDENRSDIKNQGDFIITNDINLIKSDNNNNNNIIDEKELTIENKLRKKSDDKLKEDPIVRLNKIRANITNALREVKGVLKQYSNSEKSIDIADDNINYNNQMAPVADDSAAVQFRFVRKIRRRSQLADDDLNEIDIINKNNNNNNSELFVNKQLDNIPEIKSEKSVQINEAKLKENIISIGKIEEENIIEKEFDKKYSEIITDKKSDCTLEIKSEKLVENDKTKVLNVVEEHQATLKNNLDKTNDLIAGNTDTINENLEEKTKKKLKKSITIDTEEGIAEQKTIKKKLKKQSSVDNEIKNVLTDNVDGKLRKKLKSSDKIVDNVIKDTAISEDKLKKNKLKKQNSIDSESKKTNGNKLVKSEETTVTKKVLKKQAAISIPESNITANNKITETKNNDIVPKVSKIPISVNKIDKTVSSQKTELKVKVNSSESQAIEEKPKSAIDLIGASLSEIKNDIPQLLTESKTSETTNQSSQIQLITASKTPDLSQAPKITLLDEVEQLLKKSKEKTETLPKQTPADKTILTIKTDDKTKAIASTSTPIKTENNSAEQVKLIEAKQNQTNINDAIITNISSDVKNESVRKNISQKPVEIVNKNCLLSEVEKLLKSSAVKTQEVPSALQKVSTINKTNLEDSSMKKSTEISEISSKTVVKVKPEVLSKTIPGKKTETETQQQSQVQEARKTLLKSSTVGKSTAPQKQATQKIETAGKKVKNINPNDKDKPIQSPNKSLAPVTNKSPPKIVQPTANESKTTKTVTNTRRFVISPQQDTSSINKSVSCATVALSEIMSDKNKSKSEIVQVDNKKEPNISNSSQSSDAVKEIKQVTVATIVPVELNQIANTIKLTSVSEELLKTGNKSDSTVMAADVKPAANKSNSIIAAKDVNQIVQGGITQIVNTAPSTINPAEVKETANEPESSKALEDLKNVSDLSSSITPTPTELNNLENQSDYAKPQEISTNNINSHVQLVKDSDVEKIDLVSQSTINTPADIEIEEDVPVSPHVPKDDIAKKIGTLEIATETETENEITEEEGTRTDDKIKEPKKRRAMKKVVIRRVKRKLSIAEGFAQAPLPEAETEICEKEIYKEDETDASATTELEAEENIPKEKPKPKSCLKVRAYEPGDLVMYADRVKKTQVKWRLATVVDRITSISYKLNIEGEEKTCHLSYIKKHTNKKLTFGGKEYLEIDYAQIEADEEKEKNYSIWNLV